MIPTAAKALSDTTWAVRNDRAHSGGSIPWSYILEFYWPAARPVVELGAQYVDLQSTTTRRAQQLGFYVLRFNNIHALKETKTLLRMILKARSLLGRWTTPLPTLSPEGRGDNF